MWLKSGMELRVLAVSESCSVMSDPLQLHGLYSPWNFPGQNTGVGRPTQELNRGLLLCRQIFFTGEASLKENCALSVGNGLLKRRQFLMQKKEGAVAMPLFWRESFRVQSLKQRIPYIIWNLDLCRRCWGCEGLQGKFVGLDQE